MTRLAHRPSDPALLQEVAEWERVSNALDPGEVPWTRCAMEFVPGPSEPHDDVHGFAFVTNRRLFMCPGSSTRAVSLDALGNARISEERPGYVDVSIWLDEIGWRIYYMRPLDRTQFASFLPTLHYVALTRDLR